MKTLKKTSEAVSSIEPSMRAACLEHARRDVWQDKRLTNLPKRLFEALLLAIDWKTGCCPPSSLDILQRILPVHRARLWVAIKKLVACQQIVVGPAIAPGGGVAFCASFPGLLRGCRPKLTTVTSSAVKSPGANAADTPIVKLFPASSTDEAQQ